eukprot:gene25308-28609_t
MREVSHAKIVVGPPSLVKFNFGVVGAAGAGKKTFTDALTKPYDLNGSDCQVNVISEEELTRESLKKKHRDWLQACKNPTMDEQRNLCDNRVHCIFYVFTPHQVLPEDKKRMQQLQSMAPIVPVVCKADAMTLEERYTQLIEVQTMLREISQTQNTALPTFFDFEEQDLSALRVEERPWVRNVFAVICDGSNSGLRMYPWGTVNTHHETVSDLCRLQRLVFESGSITRLRALTQQMSIQQYEQDQNENNSIWQVLVWLSYWPLVYLKWVKKHRDAKDLDNFFLNWFLIFSVMMFFGDFRYGFLVFLKMPFELWNHFHVELQKKK